MGLITNVPRFVDLFKEGQELANASTWKNRTAVVNILVATFGTFLALAKGFGHPLEVDADTQQNLAAGVVAAVAVVNAIMHVVANKDVGMPSNSGSTA